MAKKVIKNYVQTLMALLQGDEDKAIALKNARKVSALVKGQISALNSKLIDQENDLEEAVEKAEEAKYPKELIGSGSSAGKTFIDNLFNTHWAVEEAEDEIEATKEAIAMLEAFLSEHDFSK